MRRHIVCFGDSNTHGYCADPTDCADGGDRFNEEERWTRLLQHALGEDYLVVEEGLNGRTTVFQDPLGEGLAGIDYIVPCLKSHGPVDLLVIMLGTNDAKERFGASATCIALGLERLARKAMGVDCWAGGRPRLLLVAPPAIGPEMEGTQVGGCMGRGCVEKSQGLAAAYAETAALLGVGFLDAGACEFNPVDHMHLTRRGHAQLARRLAELVPEAMGLPQLPPGS